MQDKTTTGRPSGELQKSRSHSQQRQQSDSSAGSSQHSRRVGFKNNVAVYRFDSDGEDSAGYSSTVSETSEQLDGRPRRHTQQRRRQGQSQPNSAPSNDRHVPPALHDAAASWEAAREWSTAADRTVSPRYVVDGNQDRHYTVAENVSAPMRLRSNSVGSGRPQFTTISRTLYVSDGDDDGERRLNGAVGRRISKYDYPARDHTQGPRHIPSDEGCVLSCGSVTVYNPLFIDRVHYEYVQVR